MKRLMLLLAVLVMPASAWAQIIPTPPTPPAPPAPASLPTPPTPPTPPAAPIAPRAITEVWAEPFLGGFQAGVETSAAREALDRARVAMDAQRINMDAFRYDMEMQQAARVGDAFSAMSTSGSAYDTGISLLSKRDYDRAIVRFDQVIEQKATRADAAMYHKAYALYRLGRSADATATLNALKKDHPKSPYLKDASVLEAAVRQSNGQPMRPEQADDDELKLLALNALQHTDPERALPLLEGVLNGANSLQLKQRAIFVLAQSSQPRARQILMDLAKGGGNPDLQRTAIRYVATGSKSGATSAELREIYDSTQDIETKKAVLQAWGQAGDMAALLSVAGDAKDVALRTSAVNQISNAGATQELYAIYQKEQDKELKMSILSRLGSLGAADRLTDIIKSERDVEVRRRALRSLGNMRPEKSGAALADLYSREEDVENKKAIISALTSQNNGEALVAIARKETNMTLKRDIVSKLSNMSRNKAAMDYMLEIIK
jgi:HEAT repeat protein